MRMFTIVRHVYTGVFRNGLKGMLIVKFCTFFRHKQKRNYYFAHKFNLCKAIVIYNDISVIRTEGRETNKPGQLQVWCMLKLLTSTSVHVQGVVKVKVIMIRNKQWCTYSYPLLAYILFKTYATLF